jgi:hypothetical protein
MTSPEGEQPSPSTDAQARRLRWLGRAAVVTIALWFIADGLRGMWSGAGTAAQVLIVVAVVLGAAFVVVGLAHLARRGRQG